MAQTIGVVLAGGEGRRMGRPKGDLVLGAEGTLAERAARVLRPLCGNVVISVPPHGRNPAPGYSAVEDEPPGGRGPLAGIAAAFATTGRADLLVLACDYPAVGTDFLRALVEACPSEGDIVVPVDEAGRDHPLVAVWRRTAEAAVRLALDENRYKVQAIFPDLTVVRVRAATLAGASGSLALRNVNWPGDLKPFETD